jgi:hypothetical protein
VDGVREAAGFEGLIVLGVIYFILSQLQKAGKRAAQSRPPADRLPPAGPGTTPTQQEGLSLEGILRQIERVKQQQQAGQPGASRRLPPHPRDQTLPARRPAPPKRPQLAQDERGPLGRMARAKLTSAEEVEERTSLEEAGARGEPESLELTDAELNRRQRVTVDLDDAGAAVAARRLQEVEARNRPHAAVDHRAFDERIRVGEAPPGAAERFDGERLRQAIVWREILGPPKAFEE